jgi:hypothetical protein
VRWSEASSGRAAAHASFPLITTVRSGRPRRLVLGESDHAPRRRSRSIRASASSPMQSCHERRPDSQSDRPGWRHRVIACRRKRSCHAPRGAAEITRLAAAVVKARSLAGCGADRAPASGRLCSKPPPSACWAARQRLIREVARSFNPQVRDSLDPAGPQTAGSAQDGQRGAGCWSCPKAATSVRLVDRAVLAALPGTEPRRWRRGRCSFRGESESAASRSLTVAPVERAGSRQRDPAPSRLLQHPADAAVGRFPETSPVRPTRQ